MSILEIKDWMAGNLLWTKNKIGNLKKFSYLYINYK